MAGLALGGPLALDANCLSYLVLGLDSARAERMLQAAVEARRWGLQASAVAVSEVLVEPARNGPRSRFEDIAGAIETSPLISTVATDNLVARIAAEIRGRRSCKLPDAVVIASAIAGRADVLLSNDRQVVRIAQEYVRAVYFDDWDPAAPEAG